MLLKPGLEPRLLKLAVVVANPLSMSRCLVGAELARWMEGGWGRLGAFDTRVLTACVFLFEDLLVLSGRLNSSPVLDKYVHFNEKSYSFRNYLVPL